ncbi:DUF3083 family protein [Thalassotalea nanhaiensis]|uniref:DUF3083 family protein n=1 Tax=Thalassotalea nanhaiensis TaxID=3065648 RepID=A0ABY9TRC9_9GAMM|nr:DUF3083 family protein [Colwelliaceae bacterium SQ345]
MSVRRSRSKGNTIFLPSNSRYNQYLLAEFKITDELLDRLKAEQNADKLTPWQGFYQNVSEQLFSICEDEEIDNVHFIANDKLPRVRFNQEIRHWETEQQMLIFYNPEYHQFYKSHFDPALRAKKISILFLASGSTVRTSAAGYHTKVRKVVNKLIDQLGVNASQVRLRDHQHLTYDLFAKDKGVEGGNSHNLRLIKNRYQASDVTLPTKHDTISYVVASLPITRRLLKSANIKLVGQESYDQFYKMISDSCSAAAKRKNLTTGAFIANGLTPIVRNSSNEPEQKVGELQLLGFDPKQANDEFYSSWKADTLVDYVQIVFAATEQDIENKGYSEFLKRVDSALKLLATDLEMTPEHEEIAVRFHQHLAYHFNEQ